MLKSLVSDSVLRFKRDDICPICDRVAIKESHFEHMKWPRNEYKGTYVDSMGHQWDCGCIQDLIDKFKWLNERLNRT